MHPQCILIEALCIAGYMGRLQFRLKVAAYEEMNRTCNATLIGSVSQESMAEAVAKIPELVGT